MPEVLIVNLATIKSQIFGTLFQHVSKYIKISPSWGRIILPNEKAFRQRHTTRSWTQCDSYSYRVEIIQVG